MGKSRQFVINAAILTVSSITMQVIHIAFTAYLAGAIGAEGMGVQQLLMSFYGFAITLAISGSGLAATRMAAEDMAAGAHGGVRRVMSICMRYALAFGLGAALLMCLCADAVAQYWLYGRATALPVRVLCGSLPFMAASAVLSGYFMAARQAAKCASAQFMELLIRIGVSAWALGALPGGGLSRACLALALGATVSEACSCAYLCVLFALDIRKRDAPRRAVSAGGLTRTVCAIALPVAVSSYIRSGLNAYKQAMIPAGLASSGASGDTAIAQYGLIRGMALPVLMFPSALLAALGALLLPEIAEQHIQGGTERIHRTIARMLDIALPFSICAGGVLAAYAEGITRAFYGSADAAPFLLLLAPLAPMMYIDGMADSMLKGLNQQVYVVGVNILDTVTCIVLLHLLLPRLGLMGYIAVIWISEILNGVLSLWRLARCTAFAPHWLRRLAPPLCAVCAAIVLSKQFSTPSVYINIAIAAVVFAGAMMLIRLCVSISPFGTAGRTARTAPSDP